MATSFAARSPETAAAARIAAAERIPALTGVRALAAGWVLVFHAWKVSASPPVSLHAIFSTGWLGVDLFFVLSGFVLTWQATKGGDPAAPFDVRAFFARRVLRVYPAYYGCLTVLLAASWLRLSGTPPGLGDLSLHLAMFHNAVSESVGTINGVFWSLPFEWEFYLLFPLLFLLARRVGLIAFVAGASIIALAWRLLAYYRAPTPALFVGGVTVDVLAQLPFRIDEFAAGMAAAFIARALRPGAPAAQACAWTGATGLVALVAWCEIYDVDWWAGDATPFVRLPWVSAAVAALLIGLARSNGMLTRLFASRPAVWVGEVSYSVYLWHLPILAAIAPHLPAPVSPALVLAAGIPATLAVSALSYYAIERPFLHRIWAASIPRKLGALVLWGAALLGVAAIVR
ncbi:MAG TPA: acyltransferase [Casimicrobiaceae bacterium]|nr:acyltransferase [Casimicrobiaceae bacterium]